MTRLAAVHAVLPAYSYEQSEITAAFADICLTDGVKRRVLERLHTSAQVHTRHLSLPLERYATLDTFTAANDAFLEVAVDLGSQALTGALEAAGLRPEDVDLVISTTVTGLAVPSIEARIAARIGLRPNVKRLPLMGLGCVAGAAGIARMHDYLRGWPDHVAVLLSVELCSLTVQRDDDSVPNMVASALFGDGAAAVVAVGADRATRTGVDGPEVVASSSHLYPDTMRTMGWDIGTTGFRIVLDAEVPTLVERYLGDDVKIFLAEHDLDPAEISSWVCHPGGPKVLQAVRETLDLPPAALELTWRSLAAVGNLSSASVLHVLRDTIEQRRPAPGEPGLLLAMGPGFCSELVLLRW